MPRKAKTNFKQVGIELGKKAHKQTEEVWRPLPFDTAVEVSTYGRVRKDGCLLNQHTAHGYKHVYFSGKNHRVHRLVLMAHNRLPIGSEVCRHLNDIRDDNRIENLAWGTHKQNSEDAIRNGCDVGRPTISPDGDRGLNITFRLSENEKAILKDYCFAYDMSVTDVVVFALDTLGIIPSRLQITDS